MDYQSFIKENLKKSSAIASSYFGKVLGVTKTGDNNQVLTDADMAIGHYLVDSIKKQYSDHNIIDEETGVIDNKSQFTWVVDPIDGTSNFANGIPLYGIMIGLLIKDIPVAGGIALPSFSQIYYGEKGKGAWCNNEKIEVTKETNLLSSLVAYGIDGHQENPDITKKECELLAEIILSIRNLRSSNSCFDIAMVVKGKYGAYLNRTSKIWDNVAIQPLIEEAGGIVTDFFGNAMDYSDPLNKTNLNFTCCVGAPKLHKQLQEIIHK
jgi:myo-inositol-1(or 4)-monophosphatase